MPILRDKTAIDSVSLTNQPHQIESRLSSNLFKQRVELKDSPLSRMTKVKSEIEFYHIKANSSNNMAINIDNLGSIDPNIVGFEKINRMVVVFESEMSASTSTEDIGKTINVEGSFKTLPGNNLKPLNDDHFIMEYDTIRYVYRITGVNKTLIEDDSA